MQTVNRKIINYKHESYNQIQINVWLDVTTAILQYVNNTVEIGIFLRVTTTIRFVNVSKNFQKCKVLKKI